MSKSRFILPVVCRSWRSSESSLRYHHELEGRASSSDQAVDETRDRLGPLVASKATKRRHRPGNRSEVLHPGRLVSPRDRRDSSHRRHPRKRASGSLASKIMDPPIEPVYRMVIEGVYADKPAPRLEHAR